MTNCCWPMVSNYSSPKRGRNVRPFAFYCKQQKKPLTRLENIQYLHLLPWTCYPSESGNNKAYEYSFETCGSHRNATNRLFRTLVRAGANRKTDQRSEVKKCRLQICTSGVAGFMHIQKSRSLVAAFPNLLPEEGWDNSVLEFWIFNSAFDNAAPKFEAFNSLWSKFSKHLSYCT